MISLAYMKISNTNEGNNVAQGRHKLTRCELDDALFNLIIPLDADLFFNAKYAVEFLCFVFLRARCKGIVAEKVNDCILVFFRVSFTHFLQ